MSNSKIIFTFQDANGDCHIENLWASNTGTCYRIENIPFFTPGIAYGDIISVTDKEGDLHYESTIESSGHSTIQMVFTHEEDIPEAMLELEKMGCIWEASHSRLLVAVDVPFDVQYPTVLQFLEQGEESAKWTFKEACITHY